MLFINLAQFEVSGKYNSIALTQSVFTDVILCLEGTQVISIDVR